MEQVPTTSPAKEKQPASPLKDGYLDEMFLIFKARQHPIVLVEESALCWMGSRVSPIEDLDLLIRDTEIEVIKADLLATKRYDLIEQNLGHRFSDTYTRQVPRLRLKTENNISYNCVSLWSERVYMLKVDGEKIEVPDTYAWNEVLMEERFDLHLSWAQAAPISYTQRKADGVMILPPIRAQSTDMKYPIYIPGIPRIIDALLDQARYRVTYAENFPGKGGNRPKYHLRNLVRYLHLEKPQQRERLLSELAERNRGEMEVIINTFKRKPLVTLASLQNKELDGSV